MLSARKLLLLVITAVAAFAMTASSASAVEVARENPNGTLTHCPAVAPATHTPDAGGGCGVLATSETQVELGSALGMILCDNTFEARVDEAGAGYIYQQTLTNCNVQTDPCAEPEGNQVWPVNLTDENTLEAVFCVVVAEALPVQCHLAGIAVNQINHGLVEFSTSGHQLCEDGANTVEGHWNAVGLDNTAHPEIEILD